MTHSGGKPHTNVGDRGQRYEIRATGYPKDEKSVIGWTLKLDDIEKVISALCQAPGCVSVEIFDRQEGKPVITRFARILR